MPEHAELPPADTLLTVGRLVSAFGIKGWLKVRSDTDPKENILSYSCWWLKLPTGLQKMQVSQHQWRPQGLVVKFVGIDNRDQAEAIAKVDVAIEKSELPDLDSSDYYWHQLIGKRVVSEFEGCSYDLGFVKSLMATGANDVLVVGADGQSIDDRERLLPFVVGHHVKMVDLDDGLIVVDWDPQF